MRKAGDVISYLEMCAEEGVNLQRGMNYRLHGGHSVILMSLRRGAPYFDSVADNGRILIYEGHDIARVKNSPDPKIADQPMVYPSGKLTQNGLFYKAAIECKNKKMQPEIVRVYEKIHPGIWVYNGLFKLLDAWIEKSKNRNVFKFKLEVIEDLKERETKEKELDSRRMIPSSVKLEVWKRDNGRCVICGSTDNLHFDHVIPFSKGGSSLVAKNIQLLCARHNISKKDRIE
jgi:hypothetical protein